MKPYIKLHLYNDSSTTLTAHHRPFYPSEYEVQVVPSPEECDFILVTPKHYPLFLNDFNYSQYLDKVVIYSNEDNPDYLLKENISTKFIAQPSIPESHLSNFNASVVPLSMTDHKPIHLDKEFLELCRNQEKIYDYIFIGRIDGKRQKLRSLNLSNFKLEQGRAIWKLSPSDKLNTIKQFLLTLSQAKFGFAPRGNGSNSFRLYECLMVGTVPIATDVITYPFGNVNWDEFTLRGSMDYVEQLVEKSTQIDYNSFRKQGIQFWEENCKMKTLHTNLIKNLL